VKRESGVKQFGHYLSVHVEIFKINVLTKLEYLEHKQMLKSLPLRLVPVLDPLKATQTAPCSESAREID